MMLRGTLFAILTVCTLIVSCGGGGGSNSSSSSSGGSGSSIAAQVASCEAGLPRLLTAALASNQASVVVDAGPCAYGVPYGSPSGTAPSVFVLGAANIAYTNVTVCVPGTTNCQTIDHVMVDTGSSGLRIMSSVLNASLTLPAMQLNGATMVECAQFADGYSWGTVRSADVKIGGPSNTSEVASVNVQVIGDAGSYTTPGACSGTGPALNNPASFGANGVLGVGLFVSDCATLSSCSPSANLYFSCPSANACAAAPTLANGSDQVSNPVASFGTDSAGVILSLPAVTNATGEVNVFGTLTFVSASLANSTAAGAGVVVYLADGLGDFSSAITSANGAYTSTNEVCANSFIDSGSNGLFLPLTVSTPQISTDANGWFTPGATVDLTALVTGAVLTGATNTIDPSNQSPSILLTIANADTALFAANGGTNTAFSDLGGSSGGNCVTTGSGTESSGNATSGIDWGLPFFYGRPILVGLETTTLTVSGTTYLGPLWAF